MNFQLHGKTEREQQARDREIDMQSAQANLFTIAHADSPPVVVQTIIAPRPHHDFHKLEIINRAKDDKISCNAN